MLADIFRAILAHPETRGLDLDDPRTTTRRRAIVRSNVFLRDIYEDWYAKLGESIPDGPGRVVELGSGAGFLEERIPGLITSDVMATPFVRVALDAAALPFAPGSLKAIVMTNVLHHLPRPARFFEQAAVAVRHNGVVAMIEPWRSRWSEFVYRSLHHERFDADGSFDGFDGGKPLSDANGALPWILFQRDRARFIERWPQWQIERVEPMMPFRYLVSGGVSMRPLMPGWSTAIWRRVEKGLTGHMSMFAMIVLRRRSAQHGH